MIDILRSLLLLRSKLNVDVFIALLGRESSASLIRDIIEATAFLLRRLFVHNSSRSQGRASTYDILISLDSRAQATLHLCLHGIFMPRVVTCGVLSRQLALVKRHIEVLA